MKITRKQLNSILVRLPHPDLVRSGTINKVIEVPVFEELEVVRDYLPSETTHQVKKLIFEYSNKHMDWVLKNLEI